MRSVCGWSCGMRLKASSMAADLSLDLRLHLKFKKQQYRCSFKVLVFDTDQLKLIALVSTRAYKAYFLPFTWSWLCVTKFHSEILLSRDFTCCRKITEQPWLRVDQSRAGHFWSAAGSFASLISVSWLNICQTSRVWMILMAAHIYLSQSIRIREIICMLLSETYSIDQRRARSSDDRPPSALDQLQKTAVPISHTHIQYTWGNRAQVKK